MIQTGKITILHVFIIRLRYQQFLGATDTDSHTWRINTFQYYVYL